MVLNMLIFFTFTGESCFSLPKKWRAIFIFGFLLIVVLTVVVIVLSAKLPSDGIGQTATCKSPYKQDTTLPKDPSLFQALTHNELHAVRSYMLLQKELNITSFSKAHLGSNFIFLIEVYLPKKSDALHYLDENGKKPLRRARVVVINGGKQNPDVEEYIIEPLPNPSKHTPLRMSGRTYPIPFSSRPYSSVEEHEVKKYAYNVSLESYKILRESFKASYHNCTGNECLIFVVDGVPASRKQGERRSWVMFLRSQIGYDLMPVPFEFHIDHADRDPKKWKILNVSWVLTLNFTQCCLCYCGRW